MSNAQLILAGIAFVAVALAVILGIGRRIQKRGFDRQLEETDRLRAERAEEDRKAQAKIAERPIGTIFQELEK